MYNYHIPQNIIKKHEYFSEKDFLEAQELRIEDRLFPYFKLFNFDNLYAQNYPVEFLADIIFNSYSFDSFFQNHENFQHQSINPFIFPTLHNFYKSPLRSSRLNFEEKVFITPEEINQFRKNPMFRDILINSIHAFALRENNIFLKLKDNNTVLDYSIHHIKHGLTSGFNFISDNEIASLNNYIFYPVNLDSLLSLDLNNNSSLLNDNLKNYKNFQLYVNKNSLVLNSQQNQKAIKLIRDCLKEAQNQHDYVEGRDHNDFSINYNFVSNIANIAYYNLKNNTSQIPFIYQTFYNFIENTTTTKLVNENQENALKELDDLFVDSDNLNIAHYILLDGKALHDPKMLELTTFLHNLSLSLNHKEYSLENIKKYSPDHLFTLLTTCIENVNNKSTEILKKVPNEQLEFKEPSILLTYLYPLLNKYKKIEILPLFDNILNFMATTNKIVKNNQSIDKWRDEQFNDYYNFNSNLNLIYSFIPFDILSFEEVVSNIPHTLNRISHKLSNNNSDNLDVLSTSIPSFVSKAITYLDEHLNNNFFKKELNISFQNLYNVLSITQNTLEDSQANKIVEYMIKNIDISLYEKHKTPLLFKEFSQNAILKIKNENQFAYYSSPFKSLISEALDKNPDYFRNANLNILQNHWDSKSLFFYEASNLANEFGLKKIIDLFSKDFKEIPLIFSKYPEYKDYVLNKSVIGKLLEDNSPYLQTPEIQQFLRSYNGISILTDKDYICPSLDTLFVNFTEDEKKQISQFFINPEMFILEGLYHDMKWINYLSDEALNDPEYIIEVINQTYNYYQKDDASNNILKLLTKLPKSLFYDDENFKIISKALKDKTSENFSFYLSFHEHLYKTIPYSLQNSKNLIFELDEITQFVKLKDKDSKAHYELLRVLIIGLNPSFKHHFLEHPIDIDEKLDQTLSQVDKIVMSLEKQDSKNKSFNTPTRTPSVKKF